MRTTTVKETHYIEYDSINPLIPMTVRVKYSVLDDGFVTMEILEGSIDYECWNKLPV